MTYGCSMTDKLTRLNVNLVPRATTALDDVARLTENSKTDVVNRALQIYAFLEMEMSLGKKIMLEGQDGSLERVRIL